MAEELAQEGWIALWQATKTWDPSRGPLDYWLRYKADNKMLDVIRNWNNSKNSIHELVDTVPELLWIADVGDIEMAYHHGEIADAINTLSPREREYILCRFWRGMNHPELTKHFGYQPQGLQRRSFAKLSEQLAHLGAV